MLKNMIDQYDRCTNQIKKLEEELFFVQNQMYSITSVPKEVVVQGGKQGKGFQDNIVLEKELEDLINTYCTYRKSKRESLDARLRRFCAMDKEIIELKVFRCLTWRDISDIVGISTDRVRHRYYSAIKK